MRAFDSYDAIFAERGAAYHRAMSSCPAARRTEFEAVLARVSLGSGDVLVDMPAGGGYLVPHIPPPRPEIHLIEPVPAFGNAIPREPRVEVHHAALEALPLGDQTATVVTSVAGCHHLPDLSRVVREVSRVLRPGGCFVLADVRAGTPPAHFLNGFVDAHNSQGHRGVFLDELTAGALERAGLEVLVDEYVEYPWTFATPAEMAGFVAGLFGLDRADEATVLEGVATILGIDEVEGETRLRWGLQHLVGQLPAAEAC